MYMTAFSSLVDNNIYLVLWKILTLNMFLKLTDNKKE